MNAVSSPESAAAPTASSHSWLDNLQGLVFGVVMLAFGNSMLKAAGLISGQLAGLSLLGAQVWHVGFGTLFVLVNLPFYLFAIRVRGWGFVARSLVAVVAVGWLSDHASQWVSYDHLNPGLAAVVGGFSSGIGLIALFRHGASCGGMGILAVHLQDRLGWRAGWIQLTFDIVLYAIACCFLPPAAVALSLLGAVIMNASIAMNHRRDWYTAD